MTTVLIAKMCEYISFISEVFNTLIVVFTVANNKAAILDNMPVMDES